MQMLCVGPSLMAITASPHPGGSSQIALEAHRRCPRGFRSPPPHAGALQNSQRPGIAMKRKKNEGT